MEAPAAELVRRRRSLPVALLAGARPRQWLKNGLVLAAPAAAGVLLDPEVLPRVAAAVVVMCAAASGTYLVNDARDVAADQSHPRKRLRPVASGDVSVSVALGAGAALLVAAVASAFALGLAVGAVVLAYVASTTAYSAGVKRVAVVELFIVAGGFVLRALVGAYAAGVPVSGWFLIVTSLVSLMVVAGKRYDETTTMHDAAGHHRAVLLEYPPDYLRAMLTLTAGAATVTYCLWAFESATAQPDGARFHQASAVLFLLALSRYLLLVHSGRGGAPEQLLLADRPLQAIAAGWLLAFGVGVTLG